jgi:hypothetical protein
MQSRFLLSLSLVLASFIGLSSCTSGGGSSGSNGGTSGQPVIDASGKKIYTVDPATGATISANGIASSDPRFSNAAVVIPPGALSLPVDISIFQAQSLVSSSTASAVGSSNLTAAGPAVAILPSQAVSITNPLAISIPFSALTSLTGNKQIVVIAIYPGESKNRLETFVGDELDFGTAGVVKISITNFGAFQVVYSDIEVPKINAETEIEFEQETASGGSTTGSTTGGSTDTTTGFNVAEELNKIKGVWTTGCIDETPGGQEFYYPQDFKSNRTLFKFDSTSLKVTTHSYSGSKTCENQHLDKVVDSQGQFSLSAPDSSTNGAVKFDVEITSDHVTPKSRSAVYELNGQPDSSPPVPSECGQDFHLGLATTLNAQKCAAHPRAGDFQKLYTVFRIDNGRLKIGQPTGNQHGLTAATRIVVLSDFGMQKIANINDGVSQPVTPLFGSWVSGCLAAENYKFTRSVGFIDSQFVRIERRFWAEDATCQYGATIEFKEVGSFSINDTANPKQVDFVRQKAFVQVDNESLLGDFNGTATGATAFCGGGFELGVAKEIDGNQCTQGDARMPKIAHFDIFHVDNLGKLSMGVMSQSQNGSASILRPNTLDGANLLTRQNELEGGYTGSCLPGPEGSSMKLSTRFNGATFTSYMAKHSSAGCLWENYVASVEFRGTYSVIPVISGPSKLNTTIDQINMWFGTDEQASSPRYDAFYSAICSQGSRDSRSQIENLTPAQCGRPADQFNIYNIGGGFLSLGQRIGENASSGPGSTDANRPGNFNSYLDMFFGLEYKASADNPPDPDLRDDDGGNLNTPVFTLSGPTAIRAKDCVEYTISATPAPSGTISWSPSSYNQQATVSFLDSSCTTPISNIIMSGGMTSVTFKFKASLPSGVNEGTVTLKVQNQVTGQESSLSVSVSR